MRPACCDTWTTAPRLEGKTAGPRSGAWIPKQTTRDLISNR